MSATVLTVSQVNFFLKSLIEGDGRLQDVSVTGEISNFTSHYKSGHMYFSLKDEKSILKAVMFAGAAKRLKFLPENGMKVIIRGRVSVYEASGQYQLYAEDMQPDGIGALAIAYEQLKQSLEAEGLFDPLFKKPIPAMPRRIGVITSPTGAAVRDILQITARRWPVAEIVFAPVLVQGEGAPKQLKAAVENMNRAKACDVIIIGRGGGSLEDLWAFNDEGLARAVAASEIPVVSAVGHETDFTICDFVADLRAPTPSAAAELCTPDRREQLPRLTAMRHYFYEKARDTVNTLRQELDLLVGESPLGEPEGLLQPYAEKLAQLTGRFLFAGTSRIEEEKKNLRLLAGKLDALSPMRVLARGYSVAYDEKGRVIQDAGKLKPGEVITLMAKKGKARAQVLERSKEDGGKA